MNKHIRNFLWRHSPIPCIVANFKYVLVFKTTHWCWYNCAHCCENCGPARAREYIPESVIAGYIDAAAKDPLFDKNVVFTGGEVMSAYLHGPADYVPNILRHAMRAGCGTDIKTNAAWTRAKFGERIFDDLAMVSKEFKQPFQVSLSLDTFHKNAIENDVRFVSEMARRNANVIFHISGFDGPHGVPQNVFIRALKKSGLKVGEGFIVSAQGSARPVHIVNDKMIMQFGTGVLFSAGRATNIADAEYQPAPQFQFATRDNCILITFDAAGNVELGEAGRRKIHTTWRDKRGNVRDLATIRSALVKNAFLEQEKYMFKNMFKTK